LLETVVTRLREEFASADKALLFDAFKPFLVGEAGGLSYSEVAARFGMSEAAGKMTVTRMRRRYRELLRSEVANTVEDATEIDAELRHLFAALQ
jgi:DNA-directed RNA polymerase specialized sigma24 family protein